MVQLKVLWYLLELYVVSVYTDEAERMSQKVPASDINGVKACLTKHAKLEKLDLKEKYLNSYMPHIAKHWKSYNDGTLLHTMPGKVNWEQSCKIAKVTDACLERAEITSYDLASTLSEQSQTTFYYVKLAVALCKYKDVMTDTKHAKCIHEEFFRNEKLECGLEKRWEILRETENNLVYGCEESVSRCLYTSQMWRSCGKEVEKVFNEVTKEIVHIESVKTERKTAKAYIRSLGVPDNAEYAHDAMGDHFEGMKNIWPAVKSCEGFPLSKLNVKRYIKRKDGLAVFCRRAEGTVFPRLSPLLSPLKRTAPGLKRWVAATKRICGIEYEEFHSLADRMTKCTNGEDELFNCYKGTYLGMSQAMMIFGMKNPGNIEYGRVTEEVFEKAYYCAEDVYDSLRQTCEDEVVQVLMDLREMLTISVHGMLYKSQD